MKCLLKNADYIFATYSSLLKFISGSNGHKVFDYIEELYLRLIYNVYLHVIRGKRERAPHLIVRQKFVCPSVRVSSLAD